ncbi:MAG: nickel pincer cofactor biosynthesis protein LarB [Anaerovoracaceae bacterium]|jgi:NCAIR mutase (PurE)-related protein
MNGDEKKRRSTASVSPAGAGDEAAFAHLDLEREARTGMPEAVFCEGKTTAQAAAIVRRLAATGSRVLATRADEEVWQAVRDAVPQAVYYEQARIIFVPAVGSEDGTDQVTGGKRPAAGRIAVVSAGTADLPVAEEAAVTASCLGSEVDRIYDVGVAGVHRLFEHLDRIRAARVVIVVAGMEGALASVVGGLVAAPVIAVPTSVGYGANFGGLSALLTMLNSCAAGVGVVNIDNGYGAACLADRINRPRR